MNKNEIVNNITRNIINSYSCRVMIIYDKDYKGIINLKKELRKLTFAHEDFYKRENCFYNSSLEIFLKNETIHDFEPYGTKNYYVSSEADAEEFCEAILEVVGKFYERDPWYTIIQKDQYENYMVKENLWNIFEAEKEYNNRRNKGELNGIFDSKKEAQRVVYRHVSDMISKRENEIRKLKEVQKKYAGMINS